jgi:hypothetical protein
VSCSREDWRRRLCVLLEGRLEEAMEDQRGGREITTRRRLLPARMEDDQKRQAGKQPPADGSSSRGLGRGERKAEALLQAETRRQQLLLVARAKRERAGRSVFPERSSLSAVCSDFSRVFLSSAPNSPAHPSLCLGAHDCLSRAFALFPVLSPTMSHVSRRPAQSTPVWRPPSSIWDESDAKSTFSGRHARKADAIPI